MAVFISVGYNVAYRTGYIFVKERCPACRIYFDCVLCACNCISNLCFICAAFNRNINCLCFCSIAYCSNCANKVFFAVYSLLAGCFNSGNYTGVDCSNCYILIERSLRRIFVRSTCLVNNELYFAGVAGLNSITVSVSVSRNDICSFKNLESPTVFTENCRIDNNSYIIVTVAVYIVEFNSCFTLCCVRNNSLNISSIKRLPIVYAVNNDFVFVNCTRIGYNRIFNSLIGSTLVYKFLSCEGNSVCILSCAVSICICSRCISQRKLRSCVCRTAYSVSILRIKSCSIALENAPPVVNLFNGTIVTIFTISCIY